MKQRGDLFFCEKKRAQAVLNKACCVVLQFEIDFKLTQHTISNETSGILQFQYILRNSANSKNAVNLLHM
jgi:hypothetical protein